MSSCGDDLGDTGSVCIEGGWYSDSSSQGSRDDLNDEQQVLLDHETVEETVCENTNIQDGAAEAGEDTITKGAVEEFLTAEQNSQLLKDDEPNIYSDNESDGGSQGSTESKNLERLIINTDIETAKVRRYHVNRFFVTSISDLILYIMSVYIVCM